MLRLPTCSSDDKNCHSTCRPGRSSFTSNYTTNEKADWLSLTWNVAAQVKAALESLFIAFIILALAFLVLHVCTRICKK